MLLRLLFSIQILFKEGAFMAISRAACCEAINKLLKKNKAARATMSADYLRQVVDRQRLEKNFINDINEIAISEYDFLIYQLSRNKFLIARTTDKYFEEDTYNEVGD